MKNDVLNVIALILILSILIVFTSSMSAISDRDNVFSIIGYKPLIVATGSMKPAIDPGDIIVTKSINPEKIKPGDIITYRVNGAIPVTHRVVRLEKSNGSLLFVTKGDANKGDDPEPVSADRIIGKMVFKISKAGYVAEFFKTPAGFMIGIIIPLIIAYILSAAIIITEIRKKSRASQG